MDKQRRKFLKWTGAVITVGIAVSVAPYRFISNVIAPDHHYLNEFQRLSALLTDEKQLSPELTQLYYDYLYQQQPSLLTELMDKTNRFPNDANLNDYLHETLLSDSEESALLKRILKMWFYGSDNQHTLSVAAYQQSLVWKPLFSTPKGIATNMHWDRSPHFIV